MTKAGAGSSEGAASNIENPDVDVAIQTRRPYHLELPLSQKFYSCGKCNNHFTKKRSLKDHMMLIHDMHSVRLWHVISLDAMTQQEPDSNTCKKKRKF